MRYDVVSIGGGLSGLVTAWRASELGKTALVLEQASDERYLCSSRYTTGVINVMGRAILSDPATLYDAIMTGSGGSADPGLARAVADNAKRAIEWLAALGTRFIQRGLQQDQPGQQVLAPPRRLQAGLDWEGRGGDVLMRRLEERIAARGGAVLRSAKAEALVMEAGACVGVDCRRGGETLRVETGAVVVADGGFSANPLMIAQYITPRADRVLCRAGAGAQGDGIRMAQRAGAAIGGFGAFYGHIHHRNAMSNARLWPYPHLDALAEVTLMVGPDGRRFTDEGLGGVCMANAIAHLPDPLSAHLIFDEAMWQAEPKLTTTVACNAAMVAAGGPLVTAPDLASLAARVEIPADVLQETVRRFNAGIASGNFPDAPPRSATKHRPMPLAAPPFHAVPLCAGITGTMGGVVIDAHAQAQTPSGAPIQGLYAVGTPVAGLEGGPRAGYVGGLSKAFILGLIAAEHIAAQH